MPGIRNSPQRKSGSEHGTSKPSRMLRNILLRFRTQTCVWINYKSFHSFSIYHLPSSTGKLNVLGHDGNPLRVDGTEVGVHKEANQICLAGFFEGPSQRSSARVDLSWSLVQYHALCTGKKNVHQRYDKLTAICLRKCFKDRNSCKLEIFPWIFYGPKYRLINNGPSSFRRMLRILHLLAI